MQIQCPHDGEIFATWLSSRHMPQASGHALGAPVEGDPCRVVQPEKVANLRQARVGDVCGGFLEERGPVLLRGSNV